jgi:glycerol kinase
MAYILSIDSGTTSCRAIVFDTAGNTVAVGQEEFKQHFPQAGWVEHDAREILDTQVRCIKDAVAKAKIDAKEIKAVGITNQRETTVVWNKQTGEPIHKAIVWQCRRTQDVALALRNKTIFRDRTGLVPDAYFSGPKIAWILDNVKGARALAEKGDLLFGTIDTWLIWNLTGGKTHATEPSNASRTMAFNLQTMSWDDELLKHLNVPRNVLPEVLKSNANFGTTKKELVGFEAPITGVLGDQQAALFGQACFQEGMGKTTYGTGAFLLVNIGSTPNMVPGLLTTAAWALEGKSPTFALEGAIFIAGAAVQWLRDGLGIIDSSEQVEQLATSIESNEGVYFVPALVGLGSPWWDSDVRGAVVGLTRGTSRAHFARAAIESMAYQVADVADAMRRHNIPVGEQRVDGGATRNNFLMQFQADLLGVPVVRSGQMESTAWGVAALAGMQVGVIKDLAEITKNWKHGETFKRKTDRTAEHTGWKAALRGAFAAAKPEDTRVAASVH